MLGDRITSERLIKELYLDLRTVIHRWSQLTHQTAQARMGYVGQHLVSVVTGLPGGKTGARGSDLIETSGGYSEIKTCYRVDQLGRCPICQAAVSPIESSCPQCGSTNITRKDDSKWLISIRNEHEFADICNPVSYYFALFEYESSNSTDDILATIYHVDPKEPGFSLCMVDYFLQIRSKSKSQAPLNIWPHQLKFCLMGPTRIYQARISSDNTVETLQFPGDNPPVSQFPDSLAMFVRSTILTPAALTHALGTLLQTPSLDFEISKHELIRQFDLECRQRNIHGRAKAALLSKSIYGPRLDGFLDEVPGALGSLVRSYRPF